MESVKTINETDYIIVPNPIYDVVFRYLMEDAESAIIVISTLINEKIINIDFEPTTHSTKKTIQEIQDPNTEKDIHLFHLDFTATVQFPDGTEEMIMIELQKASEPDDIFRFKRYISSNFQRKVKKEIIDPETKIVKTIEVPIRLIPIFILNFRIENEINDLLIRTSSIKTGVFKNKTLSKYNEFIDNLIYDILVVQLPNVNKIKESEYINDEYKSKLYSLLKLFDQKTRVKNNDHRLRLIRKFFPGFLDRIIKRLQAADINNPDLEEQMNLEDEYLKALIDRDNQITFFKEKLNITKVELDTTKVELENEKKVNQDKDKLIENKDNLIYNLARTLKDLGLSTKEIQEKTNLTIDEINKL